MIAAIGLTFAAAALVLVMWNFWRLATERRPAFDVRDQSWWQVGERRRGTLRQLVDRLAGEHLVGVQRIGYYAGTLVVHGVVKLPTESGALASVLDPDRPGEVLRWYREFEVTRRQMPWWWRA